MSIQPNGIERLNPKVVLVYISPHPDLFNKKLYQHTLKRSQPMLRILLVSSIVFSLTFSSCFETPINNALAEIDRATNDINANSAEWQNILNRLPDKIKGKVDDTIQNELTRFVEHSAGVVSQQTVCTSDILAKRAINFLRKLRQAVVGGQKAAYLTSPIVCQVPSNIELSAMPAGHRIIEASGADFNVRDNKDKQISIAFWSDSNQKAFNIDESRIGRNTNYNLAINLDGAEIPKLVKDNDINKILFYWNESNVEQPQVLVLKHVVGTDEFTVPIGDVSLIPRHTGGDQGNDLNNDNPFQTDVLGKVFISSDQRQVLYNLYMHGKETQSDYTEVEGWKSEVQTGTKSVGLGGLFKVPVYGEGPGLLAYTAPNGWKIVSVTPLGETRDHINITQHGDQNLFQGSAGQVVRVFKVNGGEGGGEAGNQTGVTATFNNIVVKIQEIEQ
jgi:hypothetical protein